MNQATALKMTQAPRGEKRRLSLPTDLRATLIASFVTLSILPLAIALTVAITRTDAQAHEQVYNLLNSVADTKARSLELSLASSQTALRGLLAAPSDRAGLLTLLSGSQPAPAVEDQLNQNMTAVLKAQKAGFSEYFIYNTDGQILMSTDPAQVDKVVRQQPYFKTSLEREYIQPPFYELGSNNLAMIVTRQVVDDSGRTVGVLAGRVDMTDLGQVMQQRTGLGDTGETYLVSPENNYLVTPSRFGDYPLTRSYHSQGIDSALAGRNGNGIYTGYRGTAVVGAYRWLPDLQVGLLAEVEQSEAFAASGQAALASVIVALLAAAGATVAGLVIAVRITRPITELTQVTQTLAGGDLSVRAHINARNEFGTLGQSFNTMAAQLEDNLHALEASVKEAQVATAMAREANRLKSEFLATMSHELRTPLNAMIGFAELLMAGLSGPLNEKQHHKIERIHLNSKRLLELINNLLDLAKIEAGRVEVVHDPFEPARLVSSVQSQVESLAEKKGLKFSASLEPGIPQVVIGDEARIAQILNNLLSNAFKFTARGEVELRGGQVDSQTMWFSVRDTGIGIPPHALEFIFEEFRQVDGTSQRAYGGSGLGLAITRNLARIMGGEVRVSSMLGEGSTFTVVLPLITPEEARELVA